MANPITPEGMQRSQSGPARTVKDEGAAVWNEASQTAQSAFAEQQKAAASGLGDLASVLRKAARELGGEQQASVARLAESAADGLERLSGTLRTRDLHGLLQDAESFARRQPVAFFGTALAAGFLATRFVKSSKRN